MKIFCHIPREDWFCDRYGLEYKKYSKHDISFDTLYEDTSVVWLLAAWCWNQIHPDILKTKKVICTIHHEVPWKFDEKRKNNFMLRDKFVDCYHVPCQKTKDFISQHTEKSIKVVSYWCNNHLFKPYDKVQSKKKFNVPLDKLIIGSFQRDTEGFDLKTPKLEKGPDIFIDYVKKIQEIKGNNVHVLLNGWRRNYVISELKKLKIPYTYIELPAMEDVVQMYSALDLYIVGSRVEGGPQSIIECGMTNTPIVSTDVGIAKIFLTDNCIFNPDDYKVYFPNNDDMKYLSNKIDEYNIEKQIKKYDSLFEEVL
jgi:hypothetical protein